MRKLDLLAGYGIMKGTAGNNQLEVTRHAVLSPGPDERRASQADGGTCGGVASGD